MEQKSFTLAMTVIAVLGLIILTVPTLIIVVTSFTGGSTLKFPPESFSFRWYQALWESGQIKRAALNSLEVAFWTAGISVVLGTSASLALARNRSTAARLLDSLFMSPLILPAIGFGLAFLMMLSTLGIELSIATLVISHVVICVPFVIRTTSASIAQLDPVLMESSASLGAGRFFTFRHVVLPLIRRGIGAGAFLAFMASFDNVPVSLFVADARTEVLPIRMWQMIESSLDVRVAAVSGIIVAGTLILMLMMERFAGLTKQLR